VVDDVDEVLASAKERAAFVGEEGGAGEEGGRDLGARTREVRLFSSTPQPGVSLGEPREGGRQSAVDAVLETLDLVDVAEPGEGWQLVSALAYVDVAFKSCHGDSVMRHSTFGQGRDA
jgi:hypothetical protein